MTQNVDSVLETALARMPRHTFKIPESARELPTDPQKITMRQLTIEEEQQALRKADLAGGSSTVFSYEGTLRAIVAADDKPITWENDGKVIFIGSLSNKVRDLVVRAFNKVCMPSQEEIRDFFASMETSLPGTGG